MKRVKTGRKTAERRTSSKVSRPDVNDDIYEFFKLAARSSRETVTPPRFAEAMVRRGNNHMRRKTFLNLTNEFFKTPGNRPCVSLCSEIIAGTDTIGT